MERDRIGNSLRTAKNLGTLTSRLVASQDSVGKSDSSDLYRIKLVNRSSLNLQVSKVGRGAKVGVQVFALKRSKNSVLKAIGKQDFGKLKAKDLRKNISFVNTTAFGSGSTALSLVLDAGEYYFRIAPRKGSTNYKVGAAATPASPISNQPLVPIQFSRSWVQQLGTAANDYGYGIATVGDKLYVSGSTEGNLNGASQGDQDSFAALYATNGTLQWQRQFGVSGYDIAGGIAADSSGNYYVSGTTISQLLGISLPKGYVSKFASSGTSSWQKQISLNGAGALSDIAVDDGGNVYVSGFVKASSTAFATSAFVAKYDSAGQEMWSKEWSGSKSSSATSLAVDKSGNVYITGITNATLQTSFTNAFSSGDAFVAKYNAQGVKLWDDKTTLATAEQDYGRGIAVDGSGNVYITGDTEGAIPTQTKAGETDGFLAKFNTSGVKQWVKQFGTSGLDESQGIAVSDLGTVVLTGETTGGIFGNLSFGSSDAWIAAFNSDGNLVGSTQTGTAQNDEAYGITTAGSSVYVLGQTQGAIANGINQGQYDAWVARYEVV